MNKFLSDDTLNKFGSTDLLWMKNNVDLDQLTSANLDLHVHSFF